MPKITTKSDMYACHCCWQRFALTDLTTDSERGLAFCDDCIRVPPIPHDKMRQHVARLISELQASRRQLAEATIQIREVTTGCRAWVDQAFEAGKLAATGVCPPPLIGLEDSAREEVIERNNGIATQSPAR